MRPKIMRERMDMNKCFVVIIVAVLVVVIAAVASRSIRYHKETEETTSRLPEDGILSSLAMDIVLALRNCMNSCRRRVINGDCDVYM